MQKAQILSKDELIHQVAAEAGLSLKDTEKVLDAFVEVASKSLVKGISVRLYGFGTWYVRQWAGRKIASIKGGSLIRIPDRAHVNFSVGAVLAQAVAPQKKTRQKR